MVKPSFRASRFLAGAVATSLLGWGCAQVAGLDDDYLPFPGGGGPSGNGGVSGFGGGGAAGGPSAGSAGAPGGGAGGGAGAPPFTSASVAIAVQGDSCPEANWTACLGHASQVVLLCRSQNADGTGQLIWVPSGVCDANELCDTRSRDEIGGQSGRCADIKAECVGQRPGDRRCLGSRRYVCGPDLVTSTFDDCETEALCELTAANGMAQCAVCFEGVRSCQGDTLVRCNDDRLTYALEADCAAGGKYCNPEAGGDAECSEFKCDLGDFACTGDGENELQKCNDPTAGFSAVTTCSGGAPICDAAGGQCDVCGKGDTRCPAAGSTSIQTCAADGQGFTTAACPAPTPFCSGADRIAQCVQCVENSHCPGSTFCNQRVCNGGQCGNNPAADGTELPPADQVPNDCKVKVCLGGNDVSKADPADEPLDDGNPCTVHACGAGGDVVVTFPGAEKACTSASGVASVCDGKGACGACTPGETACVDGSVQTCLPSGVFGAPVPCPVSAPVCQGGACRECTLADDCAAGNACVEPVCVNFACGEDPKPLGTPAPGGTAGDCKATVCDGAGNATTQPDLGDTPFDAPGDCVFPRCSAAGGFTFVPELENTQCDLPGGEVGACDGKGQCTPKEAGAGGAGGANAGAGGGAGGENAGAGGAGGGGGAATP